MKVLVAGGLGYIGSHTVVELINNGHEVIIADDLSNSSKEVLNSIKEITGVLPSFYEVDVADIEKTEEIFKNNNIDVVMHFAAHKAVGESVEKPLKYYKNNLNTTITLSELCLKYGVNKFIFSSSATVYGDNTLPFNEDMPLVPSTNPYGETKVMCERILMDTAKVNPQFSITCLRYFNPIGAHKSGLLLEQPKGVPNNLIPFITYVAKGLKDELMVYGDDYNTKDGTGVRDYIHILDLAEGHVLALNNNKSGVNVYNLGTGKGYSVLEVVKSFEKAHNIKIPYKIVERRSGDIAEGYADCTKATKELGFVSKYSLEEMCKDSYKK